MMKKNETRIEQRVNKESLKNGAIAYEFRFFKITFLWHSRRP